MDNHAIMRWKMDVNLFAKELLRVIYTGVSDYPGIVNGKGTVKGELYRTSDAFEVMQRLDWVEGACGDNPLFNRIIRKIKTVQGEFWVYSYNYNRVVEEAQFDFIGEWN